MNSTTSLDRKIATFLLGKQNAIEMAIPLECLLEATPAGRIQDVPTGVSFLEGFMTLRNEAIPVINMKKRLGMENPTYCPESKIAVVTASGLRFGLMFDDIKDVINVPHDAFRPVHPALLNEDSLIVNLAHLESEDRIIEIIDMDRLVPPERDAKLLGVDIQAFNNEKHKKKRHYTRHVVIDVAGQLYGIPVAQARELTFTTQVNTNYENGCIHGALKLRGDTIPVILSRRLFGHGDASGETSDEARILILACQDFFYGLIVDRVLEIANVADDEILTLPQSNENGVTGVCQSGEGHDLLLVRMEILIREHQDDLHSIAQIRSEPPDFASGNPSTNEECSSYLIFFIGRRLAVKLSDIKEIIKTGKIILLPGSTSYDRRVFNLRGALIPVINLREFYHEETDAPNQRTLLVVMENEMGCLAFEVDRVETMTKEVRAYDTPALPPHLNDKRDTLDRLIVVTGENGASEHIFIVNPRAIMANHLKVTGPKPLTSAAEQEI